MTDNNSALNKTNTEIKKLQTKAVKAAVEKTFNALEALEKEKTAIQDKIRILKHDLYDLKDGRLDRIAERQLLSPENLSVFTINRIEGQNANISPWYVDYEFKIPEPGRESESIECRINNSIIKTNASGTYKMKSGGIRYL